MTRSSSMVLMIALGLFSGCGSDAKKSDAPSETDAGGGLDKDGGSTGSNNGSENTAGSSAQRVAITDGPNCAEDVATTPGSECPGVVACGGNPEKPHACPLATHSCCVSGVPAEATVNCYEGTDRCRGGEQTNSCDGADDCKPGLICCVGSLPTPKTRCDIASNCNLQAGENMFCHTDNDCPVGRSCNPTAMAAFWGFCN